MCQTLLAVPHSIFGPSDSLAELISDLETGAPDGMVARCRLHAHLPCPLLLPLSDSHTVRVSQRVFHSGA